MPLSFEKTEMKELTYGNFDSQFNYQAFLCGEALDIGGGTITKEEIDIIKDYPELKRIRVTGLRQDTFEYFIENYGSQFEAICFWKDKLVSDFSVLGNLENIVAITFFWNQRVEKLWDMSNNKKLRMLNLDDFTRLHSLRGVEKAPALEYLTFGNLSDSRSKFDNVPDLNETSLQKVAYNSDVPYECVEKFLNIPDLKELGFRANMYKVEFLAWISANYPHIKGNALRPYALFGDKKSGFICGKRKPWIHDINSEKDKKRVEKAVNNFEGLKKELYGMPFEEIVKLCKE